MNASLTLKPETHEPGALFRIYSNVRYLSIKHDSYFRVYEELFAKYIGKRITFVEVGVLNGGSLFMWREYFGPQARVIGIDLNPAARQWEAEGFEIFIGSQSDPLFWRDFYARIGPVDVLLDDGGHTNTQQIITVNEAIPNVADGGLIVVEDAHTSYMKEFGNPSRYSFIGFAKRMVDSINSRSPAVKVVRNDYGKRVHSIAFHESMVAFHIDSTRCHESHQTCNGGVTANRQDFRLKGSAQGVVTDLRDQIHEKARFLSRIPLVRPAGRAVLRSLERIALAFDNRNMKRFFE